MKKWIRVAIPVAAVAAFVAWYAFRPERLVVNRRVAEAYQATKAAARCRSLLSRDSSTAFCTRLQAAQPSTRWEMGLIFFALRVSALQMVLMCMSTWLPPTMRRT